jgi:hypothetical protein
MLFSDQILVTNTTTSKRNNDEDSSVSDKTCRKSLISAHEMRCGN